MVNMQYNQKEFDNFGNVVGEVVNSTKATFDKVADVCEDALKESNGLPWIEQLNKILGSCSALVKSMSDISEQVYEANRINAKKYAELNGGA